KSLGGPHPLQVWRRDEADIFERQYAGPGPAFSEELGAWVLVADGFVHLADDRLGSSRWPTGETYERTEKERERAEKERERAVRMELERRLAALELSAGKGKSGSD